MNHQYPLLNSPAGDLGKDLPRHVLFLRHAKALPAVDGQDDQDRPLSDVGLEQVEVRRASLAGINFIGGVTSLALRSKNTGVEVCGCSLVGLSELYLGVDPADLKAGQEAFDVLKYSSLRAYLDQDTTGWLFRYGWCAMEAIRREFNKLPMDTHNTGYYVVAGHSLFANLIAALMFPQYADALREIELGEADGLMFGPEFGFKHVTGDEVIQSEENRRKAVADRPPHL